MTHERSLWMVTTDEAFSPLPNAPFYFGNLLEAFGVLPVASSPEERVRNTARAVAQMFQRLVGVSKYLEVGNTSGADSLGIREWGYLASFLARQFGNDHKSTQSELERMARVLEQRAAGEEVQIADGMEDFFRAIVDYVAVNPVPDMDGGY